MQAAIFKKISLLIGGGASTSIGGARPSAPPPLAPALSLHLVVGLRNSKFSIVEQCKSKNRLTW